MISFSFTDEDTLRAYFAGQIMQVTAARISSFPKADESKSDARNRYRHEAAQAAWEAVTAADHLIDELKRKREKVGNG